MSYLTNGIPGSGPGSGTVTSIAAAGGLTAVPNPIVVAGTILIDQTNLTVLDGTVYWDTGTQLLNTTAVGTAGFVLTSNGAGMPPTYQAVSASGAATSFPTDAGTATPAAGIVNVLGGTAARDINTSAAGNTIHIDLNNAITLGDLAVIAVGSNALDTVTGDINITAGNLKLQNTNGAGSQRAITFGGSRFISNFGGTNTFVGAGSGNTTLTGFSSVAIGSTALANVTTGAFNTVGGFLAANALTAGTSNVAWGSASLSAATGAGTSQNTAIGASSLNTATGPVNNISIGYLASSAFTTTESDNIIIGNVGVIADSARIRIGTNPTHTSAFIAGIDGVNVGSVAKVVTMASDQLGTATITAGSGITVTPGANTITISSTGADLLAYTNVNTSPYVVLSTDEYLGVDCSAAPIQINFPNAPSTGRVFIVKDFGGFANTNNITLTSVGGAIGFDGSLSYVMNTQYASVQLIFDGTNYQIW